MKTMINRIKCWLGIHGGISGVNRNPGSKSTWFGKCKCCGAKVNL